MNATLRLATTDDARAIATISVLGWRAAYRGLMPDSLLDGLSIDDRTHTWTQTIAQPVSPEQRVWLLLRGDEPIGFASCGPSRDTDAEPGAAEIYALYLDPRFIGQGLGARLFDATIADLSTRGFALVTLWALDGNQRAERFYRKMGMVPNGEKIETVRDVALPHLRYRRVTALTR